MSETVTRDVLLERLQREKDAFETLIDRMTPDQLTNLPVVGYWTMRDVLAHLIAHEQRTLEELRHALRGETLVVDHDAVDEFNTEAVLAHQHQTVDEVHEEWNASFNEVVSFISALPDDAFAPNNSICLALNATINGAVANTTYAHYEEHRSDIRRVLAEVG